MKQKKRTCVRLAGLAATFATVATVALFFASCSQSDPNAGFSHKLTSIDSYISAGEEAKALKKLASIRSSASSASQWLSIAKRERSLGKYGQAAVTLRKASRKLPANESLTAVLVDTLIEEKKFTEAAGFTDILRSSRYTPLASYAGIFGAKTFADLGAADPEWWIWALEATGLPLFRRNAAVMHAVSGNYAAACSLGTDAPGEAYFYALLCYDAQFFDQVFVYLPLSGINIRTARDLTLMADTSVCREDTPLGRLLWSTLALRNPVFSPLPYYNLSATSANAYDEKTELEACLSLFPSYYPAVVRYVRSVPPEKNAEAPDLVADELEREGFRTLEAEDALVHSPVDANVAATVLERALSLDRGGATSDMRLRIEAFRFAHTQHPDRIRSASQMWKLLETTGNDPVVHRYAVWYFASIGNFDSCFTLNQALKDQSIPFYTALEAAFAGDLDRAETEFGKVADSLPGTWQALANIARIRFKKHDHASAIEDLSVATGMTNDDEVKSALQYETATILVDMRMMDRAASIAGYALELDPSNYHAALLLRELEAIR